MKYLFILILITLISSCSTKPVKQENKMTDTNIYDIELTKINGEKITMSDYKGKVMLIVNTASKCGYTKQYDGLQKLYDDYKDKGFVILGFPANNFMRQEPGTNEEIQTFCRMNYGVSFPMFEKISVKGEDIDPLYEYLTNKERNPEFGGKITWNFNKFLISKNGQIVNRFKSGDKPQSEKITTAVENQLKK
jgi:glutathione peroxidase